MPLHRPTDDSGLNLTRDDPGLALETRPPCLLLFDSIDAVVGLTPMELADNKL